MDTGTTESQLISQACLGDTSSFKILYDLNSKKIYSFCLRITGDIDLAMELTQKTFIKAWERLNTFKAKGKFLYWLHSIASREYLMSLRSDITRERKYTEANFPEDNRNDFIFTDVMIDVETAILKLPEKQRLVFNLFHIEGYKHKEISDMLDISEGTAKAHLHQARKKLMEELNK